MNVCKCLLKIKLYLEFPRNSICKVSWNVKFRQTSRTFSQKYQFIFAIFFESTFIIHWLFFNIHEKCCLPLMKKKIIMKQEIVWEFHAKYFANCEISAFFSVKSDFSYQIQSWLLLRKNEAYSCTGIPCTYFVTQTTVSVLYTI